MIPVMFTAASTGPAFDDDLEKLGFTRTRFAGGANYTICLRCGATVSLELVRADPPEPGRYVGRVRQFLVLHCLHHRIDLLNPEPFQARAFGPSPYAIAHGEVTRHAVCARCREPWQPDGARRVTVCVHCGSSWDEKVYA